MAVKTEAEIKAAEREALLLQEDLEFLEEKLTRSYCQLGKTLCETAGRQIEEINRLVDRMVDTKLKLCAVREQSICLSCMAANPRENAFCGRCGERLPAPEEE